MKTDRLSGRFLKQLVFWTFALILPALRIASALELHPSGSDVVHLDIAELDAIARVSLAGEQGYYYGLVFWEEFFVTVLPGPESAETGTEYLSQLQEQLSVTPLNVPGSISTSGVRSLRYQDVGQSRVLVIGRLNKRFTGLTDVILPYQEEVFFFSEWIGSKKLSAVSAVINDNNELQRLPLVFDPDSYTDIDNAILAQHTGSSLNATQAVLKQVRPGMVCLGQNKRHTVLMLLGIKTDFDVFQDNKLDGEQKLEINFTPLERFIHLAATTAGLSPGISNRWAAAEASFSPLALNEQDVSELLGLPERGAAGRYLCEAQCMAGTVSPDKNYCHTRTGDFDEYYALEGRPEAWQFTGNGQYPVNALSTAGSDDCHEAGDVICFVAEPDARSFGVIAKNKGCLLEGNRLHQQYYVFLVLPEDPSEGEHPTELNNPMLNDSNGTDDYFGGPHVVVFVEAVSGPSFVNNSGQNSVPNLQPPEPSNGEGNTPTVILAVAFPVIFLVTLVAGGMMTAYCYCTKCRPGTPSDDEYGDDRGESFRMRHLDSRGRNNRPPPTSHGGSTEELLPGAQRTTDQEFRDELSDSFKKRYDLYRRTNVIQLPSGQDEEAALTEEEMVRMATVRSLSDNFAHSEGASVSVMDQPISGAEIDAGLFHGNNQQVQGAEGSATDSNVITTSVEVHEPHESAAPVVPADEKPDLDEDGKPVVVKSKRSN